MRILLALAFLLFSTLAFAQTLPRDFPNGAKGFWFGESTRSAAKKCLEFDPLRMNGKPAARCRLPNETIWLGFSHDRVAHIQWRITPEAYASLARQIAARLGLKGRSEDRNGNEVWAIAYMDGPRNLGSIFLYGPTEFRKPYLEYYKPQP